MACNSLYSIIQLYREPPEYHLIDTGSKHLPGRYLAHGLFVSATVGSLYSSGVFHCSCSASTASARYPKVHIHTCTSFTLPGKCYHHYFRLSCVILFFGVTYFCCLLVVVKPYLDHHWGDKLQSPRSAEPLRAQLRAAGLESPSIKSLSVLW